MSILRSVSPVTFLVMLMVALFAVGQGLSYPLLAAILAAQGHGEALIGLNAAMVPVGIMVMGLTISPVTARVGARNWAIITALMIAASLLAIGLVQNIWAWFFFRFFLGLAIASQFVIAETWILSMTPAPGRGRVVGFYNFLTSVGFGLGPLLLSLLGTGGLAPFVAAASFSLLVALLIALIYKRLPRWKANAAESNPWSVLPLMMFLGLATVVLGGFDQVILAFFALFMQSRGLDQDQALRLLTVVLASGALFLLAYGWLIDALPRRALWIATLACAAGLPWLLLAAPVHSVWMWPLAAAWGCSIMPIFTLCMVELGERFTGQSLLAANGVFSLGWGLGGIILPPVAGAQMQLFGSQALIWVMSAIMVGMLIIAILRPAQKKLH